MTAPRPLVSRPPREYADLHPGASPLDLDADPPRGPRPPDNNHHRPDLVVMDASGALVERAVADELVERAAAEGRAVSYHEHRVPVSFLTPNPRDW